MTLREKRLCALFTATANLGSDELLVLTRIAERAEMGRKQYGDLHLATDKRNWRQEFAAEQLDGCFYATCELLRAEEGVS